MASRATFRFDYRVFELEWSGHFCMAFGADNVLSCGRPESPLSEAAVGLVTVGAQQYSLCYFMTERLGKL
jgi:hypothetical protein